MLCMFGNDEAYYAHAAQEISGGDVRPGLWAKALAETDYDEPRARARYLKLRVRLLKAEVAEDRRLVREQERAMERRADEEAGRERTSASRVAWRWVRIALVVGGVWFVGGVWYTYMERAEWRARNENTARVAAEHGRATPRQDMEAAELDSLITQIERAYPALNPASASFDKGRADKVVELWEAYEREGYSRSSALLKAVKEQDWR